MRRRGRPRKQRNVQGKRLFDGHSSGEEEDSIGSSDQEDGREEKQDEDEDDEAPLINAIRSSSKLRSLRVSRDDSRSQSRLRNSSRVPDDSTASRV